MTRALEPVAELIVVAAAFAGLFYSREIYAVARVLLEGM